MAFKIEKSVYYHIPKTGGTWVKDAIFYSTGKLDKISGRRIGGEPRQLRLVGCHQIPASIRDNEKLFSFTFIRHPVSWYRSFWANRKDKGFAKVFLISPLWDSNFEKFVNNVLREYPEGFVTKLYQYYIGKDGKELNFVGKQENLEDDLIKALTLAGEKFDIDKIKQTEKLNVAGLKKEYRHHFKLSKEAERRLLESEKWVINTYYKGKNGI